MKDAPRQRRSDKPSRSSRGAAIAAINVQNYLEKYPDFHRLHRIIVRPFPQMLAFLAVSVSTGIVRPPASSVLCVSPSPSVLGSAASGLAWLWCAPFPRQAAVLALLLVSAALARARYRTGLHTRAQVAVGYAVGTVLALALHCTVPHGPAAAVLDGWLDGPLRPLKCACLSTAAVAALSVRWLPAIKPPRRSETGGTAAGKAC